MRCMVILGCCKLHTHIVYEPSRFGSKQGDGGFCIARSKLIVVSTEFRLSTVGKAQSAISYVHVTVHFLETRFFLLYDVAKKNTMLRGEQGYPGLI